MNLSTLVVHGGLTLATVAPVVALPCIVERGYSPLPWFSAPPAPTGMDAHNIASPLRLPTRIVLDLNSCSSSEPSPRLLPTSGSSRHPTTEQSLLLSSYSTRQRRTSQQPPPIWTSLYRNTCAVVALMVGASPLLVLCAVAWLEDSENGYDTTVYNASSRAGSLPPCQPGLIPSVNGLSLIHI